MTKTRDIYLLNPKTLSPEVIAVAFAKTSRSPESFRDIAAELSDEKSAEFHEKWVVGYGHASVAEHAVLHIAFENVSRLAVECIESNRLASYTEKSTRYQVFDRDAYYTPPGLAASRRAGLYRDAIHALFDAYFESIEPVREVIRAQYPRKEGESEKKHAGRIRSKWIDNCRFLLPAATLANLGMTANARVLEHGITKMLSHPLEEVRDIGAEVKRVAQVEAPTLVKYADRRDYVVRLEDGSWKLEVGGASLQPPTSNLQSPISNPQPLTLLAYDPDAEVKFVAAGLYRTSRLPFTEALACARAMSAEARAQVVDGALAGRGDFDIPLRELEHITYTFECVLDNGAYFDVKRHRLMTQTPQALTVDLGYTIPRAIEAAGFRDRYCRALDQSIEAYHLIAQDFPHEASYLVANAFNRRVLLTLNLREAFHFCRLRGAPNGHFSYRRIAIRLYEILRDLHPIFAPYMRCDQYPSSRQIEEEFFAQV
ncbi:MAG TPA: FAD-dependent thymidylate synthase [Anaerolineae bacterium]|nr:FAD-dependent thymidylate synthase [Anaerolineae bacterium]